MRIRIGGEDALVVRIRVGRSGERDYDVIDLRDDEHGYALACAVDGTSAVIIDPRLPSDWIAELDEQANLVVGPPALLHPSFPYAFDDDHPRNGEIDAPRVLLEEIRSIEREQWVDRPDLWAEIGRMEEDPTGYRPSVDEWRAVVRTRVAAWAEAQPSREVEITGLRDGARHDTLPSRRVSFRPDPASGHWASDAVVAVKASRFRGPILARRITLVGWPWQSVSIYRDQVGWIPGVRIGTGRILGWASRPEIGVDGTIALDRRLSGAWDNDIVSGRAPQ